MISTSVVASGSNQVQVGMHLAGDIQAATLSEDLRLAQEAYGELLKRSNKDGILQTISTGTAGLLTGKTKLQRQELQNAQKSVSEIQQRIEQLTM